MCGGASVSAGRHGGGGWSGLRRRGRAALTVCTAVAGVLVWSTLAGGAQPYETYESAVVSDGPVAQYRFDDVSGSGTLADSAGSYTASNSGIVLGGEGPFGGSKSGSFDDEAFATLPSDPLYGATAFTAEAWVYWSGGTSYKQPIFDFGSSSTNYMYLTPASALSAHKMLFEIRTTAGAVFQVTATKLKASAWEYVAVTETSSGTLTLYVDGEQVGQTTGATIAPASLGSAAGDYLGKPQVSGEPLFGGSLSNVAFYNKALSGSQIAAHYNAAEYPVNTAAPTISGTARDGSTLTAKAGSWSGLTPITFAYQWTRCNASGGECAEISSATSTKYEASHEDVGKTLRVAVTATNSSGSGGATSSQTAVVAALKPSNTTLPVISGSANVGQLLSVSEGSWGGSPPFSYTYQWETCNSAGASCKKITGATASSYRLIGSQVGDTMRAIVTAANSAGSASATTEVTGVVAVGAPVNTALPAISGTARDGQTLSASSGSWAGTEPISYAYQWQRCNSAGEGCSNISGATGSTYVLGHGDVGSTLRVTVTASNPGGSASSTSAASAVVAALAPSNTALPVISGTARYGQTLTASTGEWVGTPPLEYAYQWESCGSLGEGCLDISGATSSSYTLGSGEVGDTLRVVVTATNSVGSASALSEATAVVTGSSSCTDTWTGEAGDGLWQTAGNWSTGSVPGPSEIACIGSGETVQITEGTNRVGSLEDQGGLVISGGSLELVSSSHASSVGSLSLSEATLSGPGTLDVTSSFTLGSYATMSGSGSTVVKPGVTGEIYASSGCEEMRLSAGRTLVNEGTLTFGWGTLFLSEGARLQNEGVFIDNTESSCYGPQIQSPSESGAAPSVLNTGTFEKTGGGGTSTVAVNFSNQDGVEVEAGTLDFSDGGIPEEIANGSWSVQGGQSIELSGGTFWIAEAVNLSAVTVDGATVIRVGSGPPSSSAPPVVSGEPLDGETLSASTGTWTGSRPISYSYQWQRCNTSGAECANIAGAMGETYALGDSDVGATVIAVVTAKNSLGSASAASSPTAVVTLPPPPSNTAPPEISGFAQAGQPLNASTGSWASPVPLSYSYQWERCDVLGGECIAISGATTSTYVPVLADVGHMLTVQVTATNPGGSSSATSLETSEVLPAAPVNVLAPSLSNNPPGEGVPESASTGIWTGESVSYGYQWQSCNEKGEECADIEGAHDETYEPGPGNVGNTLRVVVTASNAGGFASVSSEPSAVAGTSVTAPLNLAPPEISGTAQAGQTLSASSGTWTGTPPLAYSYQWESCNSAGESCADVSGATESSYHLAAGDVADTLRVVVTASNAAGYASRVSSATAVVVGSSYESESVCTDTWIGPSEGSWQEVASWSTGSLPGPADVACVGAGTTVRVSEGSNRAGVLDDAGELVISGGSLELTDAAEASMLASLRLSGSGAALTGAGSVYVSGGFDWGASAVMSGSGATVIASGVSGEVEASSGCEPMKLSGGRKLVNEGTLTFGWGTLYMSEGARLENEGSFVDNSEASCLGPQIQPEGSGAAPAILNTGTFEKTAGSGTSMVAVAFTNDGAVSASSGTLEFTGGGVPEQAATGSWSVEPGTRIVLGGGTFLIGEDVNLSEVAVEGATVTRVSAPVPVNTAPPSIAGTIEDGQTLTADTGSWSGSEPISFSYRWQRCNGSGAECANIAGATGEIYALGNSDVGATIRVLIVAHNSYGQTQASSPASAVVALPSPPSNTALPTITGQRRDGSVLSTSVGSWNAVAPVSYTYRWESCNSAGEECAPVENATTPEYELSEGDIGSTLRVVVTATNEGGSTQAISAVSSEIQAEAVSELEAPSISGASDEHQVLHADPGRWAGTETQINYQWESCSESGTDCAAIEGATGTEYDLAEGDVATRLRVRVGASNALDSLTDVSAATAVVGAPGALANVSAPSISGAPQVGQALTANPGIWSGTGAISYLYQWQSCDRYGLGCEDIEGANAASYASPSDEAGRALRVLITASDEGHSLSENSPATQPIATAQAPVIEQAPPITGVALAGQTLTAGTGVFSGESPITYSYQWERCVQPGSCADIEGAKQSSYALTESDIGSTILVLVSAADAGGSTTAVSALTAAVGPESLLELSAPSISGIVQIEGTLSADPGIWSASGSVSYAYQWESCNPGGEDCAPIEAATEPTYVVVSGDLGSTLRVEVTATSPLGSSSTVSAPTAAAPDGAVSVEEAQIIAEQTDPALLAPSTTATLEEQSITPRLTDTGEELASQSTLTSSTISKETAGALAVNTPAGEVSLAPVESSTHAITPPTIVNGAAALTTNIWPATDTIVRPEPLGATALLDIRSTQAPHFFAWRVNLGPDEELKQLPDGAIAVVETPEEENAPRGTAEEAGEAPKLDETPEGSAETSEEKAEAEQAEAESKTGEEGEEEAPLPTLPGAPTSTEPAGEAGPGQPQPQNTQSSYEMAKTAMSYAEDQTAGKALLTVTPPSVTDAEGAAVPASLSATGDTIELTIKPSPSATYPLLLDTTIAAPTNEQSIERDPVKYGISDPKANESGHIDEHFTPEGKVAPKFDPNLYDGPPHTTRHMRTARLVVPYDVLVTPSTKYRLEEKVVLEAWLKKVTDEGLEPYITIGQDYHEDPCGKEGIAKCPQPSIGQYRKAVTKLLEEVIRWHASTVKGGKGWRLVKLWGAWNEPDGTHDPLHKDRPRAAQFWEVAQSILGQIEQHYPCKGCTVVAGEFSTFYPEYTSCYRNVLLYNYCFNPHHHYARYWSGKPRDPTAWGFHDYGDLSARTDTVAQEFAKFVQTRLEKPRLFMSEAGVLLQNGETATTLAESEKAREEGRVSYPQLKAAEEFLKLPEGLSYPIDRMYYYQYTAPTRAQQSEHDFDSALLEEENGERRERPAYCVLAYEDQRCPPIAITGPSVGVDLEGHSEVTIKLTATVNPYDLPTEYRFEYGRTPSSLASRTPLEKLNAGLNPDKVRVEITLPASFEECYDKVVDYFRIKATNPTGTRYGALSEIKPSCPT